RGSTHAPTPTPCTRAWVWLCAPSQAVARRAQAHRTLPRTHCDWGGGAVPVALPLMRQPMDRAWSVDRRKTMKGLMMAAAAVGLSMSLAGCGDPCADYAKKVKEKCAASAQGNAEALKACEASADAVVKAGNKDACKAGLE